MDGLGQPVLKLNVYFPAREMIVCSWVLFTQLVRGGG